MSDPRTARAEKAALRSRALAARRGLGRAHRDRAGAAIRRQLAGFAPVQDADTLLGYAAFGDEVDLDGLLRDRLAAGAVVALPYVDEDGIAAAAVAGLDGLVAGFRGVREPAPAGRQPLEPSRIDVALVPAVAFDRRGRRLGYGGGHLDRLLATLRPDAVRIAVGYTAQLVDAVPRETHDVVVDFVVHEEEILTVER